MNLKETQVVKIDMNPSLWCLMACIALEQSHNLITRLLAYLKSSLTSSTLTHGDHSLHRLTTAAYS